MKLSDMTKEEFDEYMIGTWLFKPATAENVYLAKKDLRERVV